MTLSVDKLKPGMRIIHNVTNLNQAVVLPADTEVTAGHIRMLKMWGIRAVEVAGEKSAEDAPRASRGYDMEILRKAEAEVDRRLKHVPIDIPAVALVRNLAIKRAAARLAGTQK
jgi:hypothetical protein